MWANPLDCPKPVTCSSCDKILIINPYGERHAFLNFFSFGKKDYFLHCRPHDSPIVFLKIPTAYVRKGKNRFFGSYFHFPQFTNNDFFAPTSPRKITLPVRLIKNS